MVVGPLDIMGSSLNNISCGILLFLDALRELHLLLDCAKSVPPSSSLVFLGVGVDFTAEAFIFSAEKSTKAATLAEEILSSPLVGRSAASLAGKLAFLTSVCPVAAVWTRHLQRVASAALRQGDVAWDSLDAGVASGLREELTFWRAGSLAGQFFLWPDPRVGWHVLTDASDFAGGVTIANAAGRVVRRLTVLLPAWLGPASASAARELHVAVQGLYILDSMVVSLVRATVHVHLDAQAAVCALGGSGRAPSLAVPLRWMLDWMLRTGASVTPLWHPRAEMAREDRASKTVLRTESRVLPWVLDVVRRLLGLEFPSVDLFATERNAVALRFVSRWPEPTAAGMDGLLWPLEGLAWSFPPFPLARAAYRRHDDARMGACFVPSRDVPANATAEVVLLFPAGVNALSYPPFYDLPSPLPVDMSLIVWRRGPSLRQTINGVC